MALLDEIISATRLRVERLKQEDRSDLSKRALAQLEPRGFEAALRKQGTAIIAEIKRVSPLKGPLNEQLDAAAIARAYATGGAAAISVVTEPDFFHGSLGDLEAACDAGVPVLRKDFILDPLQVLEARASGADAVLLIVRVVSEQLQDLLKATIDHGVDALVEVYDERDVDLALTAGAPVIGVNHRDLDTFEVDPDRTAKLSVLIPDDVVLVALSGVSTRGDVEALEGAGAKAVLVGESLVTAADPAAKVRELVAES